RPFTSGNGARRSGSTTPAYLSESVGPQAPAAPARGILAQFEDEIQQVKGMAIGYLMSGIRDLVEQSLPQLKPQIHNVMNSITTKLGGTPVSEMDMRSGGANWR